MNEQNQKQQQEILPKGSLSTKQWLITYLILFVAGFIPLLPIILLLYWAFSADTPICKKNWAKASLIFALIVFVFVLIFVAIYGASIASMMQNMPTQGGM